MYQYCYTRRCNNYIRYIFSLKRNCILLEYNLEIKNEFLKIYTQIHKHTCVDTYRCFILHQFAKHAANLPEGDVAEIGVYKGGTAKLIAKTFLEYTSRKHTIHLFDTFTGMPPTHPIKDTHHKEGDFKDTTLQTITNYLQDCSNIQIYPGFFPQTAKTLQDTKFCFVHIDADIYQSVMDCCVFFYSKLIPSVSLLR